MRDVRPRRVVLQVWLITRFGVARGGSPNVKRTVVARAIARQRALRLRIRLHRDDASCRTTFSAMTLVVDRPKLLRRVPGRARPAPGSIRRIILKKYQTFCVLDFEVFSFVGASIAGGIGNSTGATSRSATTT